MTRLKIPAKQKACIQVVRSMQKGMVGCATRLLRSVSMTLQARQLELERPFRRY